jgi:hypothetical protein
MLLLGSAACGVSPDLLTLMSPSEAAGSAAAAREVGTPSDLTRALQRSIEKAKQRPGMRPCRISLAKDPVAFYTRRLDLLWAAYQSGARIPAELKQDVENMRRYERKHPGEMSRMAAEVTRFERRLVEGVEPQLRQRVRGSGGRGRAASGRPAARATRARRGGDSGDRDDPSDPEPVTGSSSRRRAGCVR